MLDVTPGNLSLECDAAMRVTERECKPLDDQVKRYKGPAGCDDDEDFDPVNHAYQTISLGIGRDVYANPEWDVSSKRGPEEEADAQAMSMMLNRWTRDIDLRTTLRQLYVDYKLGYCVACIYQAPVPGSDVGRKTSIPWRPQVKRISPRKFFRDPWALTADDCRFYGHQTVRDKEDLIAEATANPKLWNLDAIKALPDGGREEKNKDPLAPDRKQVVIRHVWVPEYTLPENDPMWLDAPVDGRDRLYHGTLFMIGIGGYGTESQRSDFIAPPRPYFGPRWGMYQVGEYLPVPDSPYGLASEKAVEGQIREVNTVRRALRAGVERRKTNGIVNAKDAQVADILNAARDGEYVKAQVDDVTKSVAVVTVGGLDPDIAAYGEMVNQNLEQNSGLAAVRSGAVSGRATATENTIAAGSGEARSAGEAQQFTEGCVVPIGRTAAWYGHYDDRYVTPLGDGSTFYGGPPNAAGEAVRASVAEMRDPNGQPLPVEMQAFLVELQTGEAAQKAYEKRDFDDLEFAISPMSMERPSEVGNQQRVTMLTPLILQAFQISMVDPRFNLNAYLKWVGKAFRAPEAVDMVIQQLQAPVAAAAMQGLQAQAAGEATPRMGSDVKPTQRHAPQGYAGGVSKPPGESRGTTPGMSSGQKSQGMVAKGST